MGRHLYGLNMAIDNDDYDADDGWTFFVCFENGHFSANKNKTEMR